MKDLLALVLSFSMISAPVYAQDDGAPQPGDAEETFDEAAPADETGAKQPEKMDNSATEGAADEKSTGEASDAPEPKKKVIDETGAPPTGTGKWVTGIAVASAGTILGMISLVLSKIDCKDTFKDADDLDDDASEKKKNDDNIRNCEKNKPNYRKFGTVSLIGGVGVGVPLIYFGLAERKVYKDWRAAKESEQAGNTPRPSGHADLVLLPNAENGITPGLSLTYTF